MSKQPTIITLADGYTRTSDLNKNFDEILEAFTRLLSRDGELPNQFTVDLDIADANVTNVTALRANEVLLDGRNLLTLLLDPSEVQKLNDLDLTAGDILYYDEALASFTPLPLGDPGQVLKVADGIPSWGEDVDTDTDTDTVGVTVQEDGVTVAENVVTINFESDASGDFVTDAGGGQADIDIPEAYGPIYENSVNLDEPDNYTIDGNLGNYGSLVLDLTGVYGVPAQRIADGEVSITMAQTLRMFGGVSGFEHSGGHSVRVECNNASDVNITELTFSYSQDNVETKPLSGTQVLPVGTRYLRFDGLASPNAGVSWEALARSITVFYNT